MSIKKDNIELTLSEKLKSIDKKMSISPYDLNIITSAKSNNFFRSIFLRKKLVFIISFLLIFLTTVGVFAYNKFLYDSKSLPIDDGLKYAEENGLVNYTNYTLTINGITASVLGVISDSIRTVLYVDIKGSINNADINDVSLTDNNNTQYKLDGISNGSTIEDTKFNFKKKIEFTGGAKSNTTAILKINKIGDTPGPWIFKFPIEVIQAKEYTINKDFIFDDTTITINKIICSASTIEIIFTENGKLLNICDGTISDGSTGKANLLRSGVVANKNNAYEGSAFFSPLNLSNVNNLKWSIYTSYNTKLPIEIIIPIK